MDPKYKDVLKEQRAFLVRNVVVTQDLMDFFKEQHVFLDTMLTEIEECKTREKKVNKIVDLLLFRPRSAFIKFCDCLFFTGHSYIAEHLKDEERLQKEHTDGKKFDITDIYKKIPMLDKMLRESEKGELSELILKKIETEIFRREAWKTTQDKERALDRGTKNIEQSWQHVRDMKDKDAVITSLHRKLEEEKKATQDQVFQFRQARNQYQELKQKYDKVTAVQNKYSQANENTIKRLEERINFMDKLVASVNTRMRSYLGKDATLTERELLTDQGMSLFRENFERLMRRISELEEIKEKRDELMLERENMMAFFGLEGDSKRTLWGAFRNHLITLDEKIQTQRQEVVALNFKLNAKKMLLKRQTQAALAAGENAAEVTKLSEEEAEQMHRELADLQDLKEKAERLNDHLNAKILSKDEKIKELEEQLESSKVTLDQTRSQAEMEKLKMSLLLERENAVVNEPDEEGDELAKAYGDILDKPDSRPVSREIKDLNSKPVIPPISSPNPPTEDMEDMELSQTFKSPKRKVIARGGGSLSSTFHDKERLTATSGVLGESLTVKKL